MPRWCAPERRRDRAARLRVTPICRASDCKRLRSPQPASCAQPVPPASQRPEAPAETRSSRAPRPARSGGLARAVPAAALTRACEPLPGCSLTSRSRGAAPIHSAALQGRVGGETCIPGGVQARAAAKPEPKADRDFGRGESRLGWSLDRSLPTSSLRLTPGLRPRSRHCSVRVRGRCGLPGPERTRRGAWRPRGPRQRPPSPPPGSQHAEPKFLQVQPAETPSHTNLGRAVKSASAPPLHG